MAESKKPARILVVDDEPTITEFVSYALAKEGYAADMAGTAEEAIVLAGRIPYDLFILDVMLPGADGYALCRAIRAHSDAPVLFLSARDSEQDKVMGLEMGADDYLAKPFGMLELIARVRALLRRRDGRVAARRNVVSFAGITLDEDEHTAVGPSGPIDLSPREFELLACLMKAGGRVVSREDLLRDAWGWEYTEGTKTVETHVKRLRGKFTASGHNPKLIVTVRGCGYALRDAK